MRDALRVLPPFIGRGLTTMFLLHDVTFMSIAILGAFQLPPSVRDALDAYGWIWIVCVGFGSLCASIGTMTRNVRWEVLGCGLMIAGLITYAMALLVRAPHNGGAGIIAAGIFLAAAFSLGARIFVMFAAIYLREPRP